MAVQGKCNFKKADGKRCNARARTGDKFCFFHSPATAVERKKAQRAGGVSRSKPVVLDADTPEKQLSTSLKVCELLSDTINQVRCGKLDPRIANTVGYLAATLLRALEQGPVEDRLSRLETTLGLAGKDGIANARTNHTQ